MRRKWGIGAAVAVLLVLLPWLHWRSATAPESVSRAAGRPVRPQAEAPASLLLGSTTTLAEARGTLSIQGRVEGPYGPVPGALVVALAPASREWLSLTLPQRGGPPGRPVSSCDLSQAVRPLLELAAELRGRQPPLARATTDTQGRFLLEGLEAGSFTLWAESAEGLGLRREVAAGSGEVEVRLGPGMTLSGVVQDDQGRPAAGALVTALQRDAGRFIETSTNDEGRFLLGPLPWGNYEVLVSKEGLAPVRLESSTLVRGPARVTLPTPRRIAGQVVDERGPVPGAAVQLEGAGASGAPAVTDGRGRFSLEVMCPGQYVLTASHEGRYARHEVSLETGLDREAVTLLLGPSLRLSGRVTGTSGQPIEGAEVSLFGGELQWMGSARTDSRGGFLFEQLAPGTYTTVVRAAYHEPIEVPPRLLTVSQELRFTLKEAERRTRGNVEEGALEVEWVDAMERPVSQAQVRVYKSGSASRKVTTGMDGRAVFQGLEPGSYFLEPQALESWSRYALLRVEVRGSETRRVRLQSEEGWSLSGQVVDAEGNPIEGALVIASRVVEPGSAPEEVSSGPLRRSSVQGLSGPGGGFTLANLPEGPCSLRVHLRGYVLDTSASSGLDTSDGVRGGMEVSPGNPDVRLVLRAQAQVRGRVVREDGGPITSFRVNRETVSHPEGRFSLPVGGARMWTFTAPGFSHVRREVAPRQDEDLELGDVVLMADRTVRGRVVEAGTSAPVARARVQVRPHREHSTRTREVQVAYSLPDGSFTAEGVKAGGGVVRVTHPDWPPVRMELAEEQREVTVVLVPGATLEGRIESAGAPVPSGSVMLRSEQGEILATTGFWEGRYSLRAVPAGRYLVQVTAQPGEGPAPLFPVRQVELTAGGSVTLDFIEQVEGAVVEVFVPERDIEVHLIPGDLPLMGPRDGLYSKVISGFMGKPVREGVRGFPPMPAGSYTLFAMRRGEDVTAVHREELEVPTGGDVAFTLLPQWSLFDD